MTNQGQIKIRIQGDSGFEYQEKKLIFGDNFWDNLRSEINDLFLERTRDWRKDIPAEYYWKACPISIPTLYRLEDDYLQEILGIIKDLSAKYSRDINIENWKVTKIYGKISSFEFGIYDSEERSEQEIKTEELTLAKKIGMLGF